MFLVVLRNKKINTRNNLKASNNQKSFFRLREPSVYKFINFRISKLNNLLFFFCNIGSRTQIYPMLPHLTKYKTLQYRLKTKLQIIRYKFVLLRKRVYKKVLLSMIKNTLKKKVRVCAKKLSIKNLVFKFTNINKKFLKIKKKNVFIKNTAKLFSSLHFTNSLKKELNNWKKEMRILKKLVLRPLKKQIFLPAKSIKYKVKRYKLIKIKRNKFIFKSPYVLKKNILLKKNTKKKIYSFFKKLIFAKHVVVYDTNICNVSIKKNIYIKNVFKNVSLRNQKKKLNYKKKNTVSFFNLHEFYYAHLFLKFFEHKLIYFISHYTKLKFTQLNLQEEFSMPRAVFLLKNAEKRIKSRTFFLKQNKKFYSNFINLMPIIQTHKAIQLLATQIAFELSRTKKHWRVIKGIQLIIMQSFIQLTKEPIESTFGLIGLRIKITGRPNKSSRTRTVILNFGKLSTITLKNNAIFETFATSNAQIGSFGITITGAA